MEKAVLIASFPRSGSHYLEKNLIDCGMFAHRSSHTYLKNIPASNMFAKSIFKDAFDPTINIKTSNAYLDYLNFVFILRKPEDSIISLITQNRYSKFYYVDDIRSLDVDINQVIVNATLTAKSWQYDFSIVKDNINKIVPFTFEQLINTPENVIKTIAKESNYLKEYSFKDLQTEDFKKDYNKKEHVSNYIRDSLYLKTSKSVDLYNKIDEVLRNHPLFKDVNTDYLSMLESVKQRQIDLNIEFSN
jgi:hypothetical protein